MLADSLLVLTVVALCTLPGYALLTLTSAWREWRHLQRLCLAMGVSIALYPVLYYFARWLAPGFAFRPWMWWVLLAASIGVIAISWRRHRGSIGRPDAGALAFVAIVLLSFLSRAWVAVDYPYPAWSDSLHHAMTTELTAAQGRLPWNLLPYFDVPLTMYHLGLYALTGTVVQLTQAPAYSALLWTAQMLNTFGVFGVFLVLDRYVSRTAAVAGALTAGLLAHQPAFYVNWGRFTQLASQTVLLIAWVMTVDTLVHWRHRWRNRRWRLLWQVLFAALVTAALFMLHFRAAAFYLLLLGPTVLFLAWRAWWRHRLGALVVATAAIGVLALLLVSPVLWEALARYIGMYAELAQTTTVSASDLKEIESRYFSMSLDTFPYLMAHPWLAWLAVIGAGIGLVRRNLITWLAVVWTALLTMLGYVYLLGIPILAVTNLGAVLIMFYLPIALVIGVAVEEILRLLPARQAGWMRKGVLVAAVGIAVPFVVVRAHDVEPFRFFVTDQDMRAMAWIDANLPLDAAFAVNTTFFLPNAPHGTDAGYWIPYFTHRKTNTGVMNSSSANNEHARQVLAISSLAKALEGDPSTLAKLRDQGYEYVYIGARGNFDGAGLNAEALVRSGYADLIYADGGVAILRARSVPPISQP